MSARERNLYLYLCYKYVSCFLFLLIYLVCSFILLIILEWRVNFSLNSHSLSNRRKYKREFHSKNLHSIQYHVYIFVWCFKRNANSVVIHALWCAYRINWWMENIYNLDHRITHCISALDELWFCVSSSFPQLSQVAVWF